MDFEITPQELRRLQEERNEELVLLDVREPSERAISNIEPSLYIPMADLPARVQELNPERHIVVYCHHGIRSLSVTEWLRKQGYEKVQSLSGGVNRWSSDIDPRVPRY